MSYSYLVVILSAIIGLIVATYFFWNVVKRKVKNQELSEIAGLIQEGSAAFLKREYAISVSYTHLTLPTNREV